MRDIQQKMRSVRQEPSNRMIRCADHAQPMCCSLIANFSPKVAYCYTMACEVFG